MSHRIPDLDSLSPAKRALLQQALSRSLVARRASAPRPRRDLAPLTPFQRGIWLAGGMAATPFAIPLCHRLRGELDGAALVAALADLVDRHEPLRTVVTVVAGEPRQRVLARAPLEVDAAELTGDGAARLAEALRRATELAVRPFELERGPLVRAGLYRVGDDDHLLALVIHHIVADGASLSLLVADLAEMYAARLERRAHSLAPPVWQFGDVAQALEDGRDPVRAADELEAAAARLAGAPVELALPFDRPRPSRMSYRGARLPLGIDGDTAARLTELAGAEGTTLFAALMAGIQALVARLSGSDSVTVAFPVSRRDRPEHAAVVGPLLNTLVCVGDLSGRPTFRALLRRTAGAVLGALAQPDVPCAALAERLDPGAHPGRPPLFSILFAFGGPPAMPAIRGVTAERLLLDPGSAEVDLSFDLEAGPREVAGFVNYNTDVFDEATVRRLGEQLRGLLDNAAVDPDARVEALVRRSAADGRIARRAHDSARPYPRDAALFDLFAEAARRTPDAPAIADGASLVTYGELHLRARRVAGHLLRAGLGPEEVVALASPRSAELVAAMLGALAAGGAYLPIDPGAPEARNRFQLSDARVRLAIGAAEVFERAGVASVDVDALDRELTDEELPRPGGGDRLAHVMYTSGSTGVPKGVAVTQRGVARMVVSPTHMAFAPGDRVAFGSNPIFDAATLEVWGALVNGCCLVVADAATLMDPARLHAWLRSQRITSIILTTSLFNMVVRERPDAFAGLDWVLVAGEAQVPRWCRQALEAGMRGALLNGYGPTEATTWSTGYAITAVRPGQRSIPIGTAVANCRVHVLDGELGPSPTGMVGELFLGGDGLARGYAGRPDLTAERFLPDPDAPEPGARMYRTGDLVRVLADGALDFVGRADGQIKLRGQRIELGEIEARLADCAGVAEAVVAVEGAEQDERRLVAWVVAGPGWDGAAVAAQLAAHLPAYMVPALVPVAAIPRTPSGKLDRRALPGAAAAPPSSPPRTPLESILAEVFARTLGVGAVGRDDDFFARGGHSLQAAEVTYRVSVLTGVQLPFRAVFESRTVANLAAFVLAERRVERAPLPPVTRIDRRGPLAASPTQARLWFLDRLNPGRASYNMPIATELRGPLDLAALSAALSDLVRRHEVLRTRYGLDRGDLLLHIDPPAPIPIQVEELAGPPGPRLAELAGRGFDLEREWPIRAHLLDRGDGVAVLLLLFHHIAFDGASIPIVFDELAAAYAALRAGRVVPLAAPALQAADVAAWRRSLSDHPSIAAELAYWRDKLAGPLPRLALPADHAGGPLSRGGYGAHRFRLPAGALEALDGLAREVGATRFMGALALFAAWLHRVTGTDDLVVGTPIAGRDDAALERLVGAFLNTLALRIDLSGRPSLRALIGRVRAVALGAYVHSAVPFERVVEELGVERDLARDPVFEVLFAFTEGPAPALALEEMTSAPVECGGGDAKLDLELGLRADGDELTGFIEYDRARFEPETIERFADGFSRVWRAALESPDLPVGRLRLLGDDQRGWILDQAVGAGEPAPVSGVVGLVDAAASRAPDAIAVVEEDRTATYAEIVGLSRAVAARLSELPAESRALLLAERSIAAIAAMLGALRAGVAFVPVDPSTPAERLRLLAADCAAACVLVADPALAARAAAPGLPVIDASRLTPLGQGPEPGDDAPPAPLAAACVLYTSGSTGAPKGVLLSHGSLGWYAETFARLTGLSARDALFQFSSLAFDASLEEIFSALVSGARLVLRPAGPLESFASFAARLRRESVTVIDIPTAVWHEWMRGHGRVELPTCLRLLVVGGEAATLEAYRAWLAHAPPGCRWINVYGPTEITCIATALSLEAGAAMTEVPSIGRPLVGARALVLDDDLEPAPPGVVGELYLGGPGLARGYLGRAGLTAERFVPGPFGRGERLYRTGDRARLDEFGQLHFLGRRDQQIKLRGVRIEPAEIEAAVSSLLPGAQAAVVLRDEGPSPALVAYVVPGPGGEVDPDALRRDLHRLLPAVMVPSAFVPLESFRLTTSGKIDRAALPEPAAATPVRPAPPADPIERLLVEIWRDVLDRDQVGAEDGFFELGGHSLLATRVISRVHDLLGIDVPLRAIFEAPTVTRFAALLAERHERWRLNDVADTVLEVVGLEPPRAEAP